jgi:hypothetical protein
MIQIEILDELISGYVKIINRALVILMVTVKVKKIQEAILDLIPSPSS